MLTTLALPEQAGFNSAFLFVASVTQRVRACVCVCWCFLPAKATGSAALECAVCLIALIAPGL